VLKAIMLTIRFRNGKWQQIFSETDRKFETAGA